MGVRICRARFWVGIFEELEKAGDLAGFGDDEVGAEGAKFFVKPRLVVAGDDEDGGGWAEDLAGLADKIGSGHAGQVVVHEDDLGMLIVNFVEGLFGVFEEVDLRINGFEEMRIQFPCHRVVFNDEQIDMILFDFLVHGKTDREK